MWVLHEPVSHRSRLSSSLTLSHVSGLGLHPPSWHWFFHASPGLRVCRGSLRDGLCGSRYLVVPETTQCFYQKPRGHPGHLSLPPTPMQPNLSPASPVSKIEPIRFSLFSLPPFGPSPHHLLCGLLLQSLTPSPRYPSRLLQSIIHFAGSGLFETHIWSYLSNPTCLGRMNDFPLHLSMRAVADPVPPTPPGSSPFLPCSASHRFFLPPVKALEAHPPGRGCRVLSPWGLPRLWSQVPSLKSLITFVSQQCIFYSP